jgi:hypothetical protein
MEHDTPLIQIQRLLMGIHELKSQTIVFLKDGIVAMLNKNRTVTYL